MTQQEYVVCKENIKAQNNSLEGENFSSDAAASSLEAEKYQFRCSC